MRSDRAIDDRPQVRADLVGAALFDRMAGSALLEHGFAGFRVSLGQQVGDRGRLGGAAGCGTTGIAFDCLDDEAGFSGACVEKSELEAMPTEKMMNTVPSSPPRILLTSNESIRPRLPFPADMPSSVRR
jgi:hypothetical protein